MEELKITISVDKLIKLALDEQRTIIRDKYKLAMGEATAMLVDDADYPTAIFNMIKSLMS